LESRGQDRRVIGTGVAEEVVLLFPVELGGLISRGDKLIVADYLQRGEDVLEPAEGKC